MRNILLVTNKKNLLDSVIKCLKPYGITARGITVTPGDTKSLLSEAFKGMDTVFLDNGVLPGSLSDGNVELNGLVQYWTREKGLSPRECRVFQIPFSGEGVPSFLHESGGWRFFRSGQYRDADFIAGLFSTNTSISVH